MIKLQVFQGLLYLNGTMSWLWGFSLLRYVDNILIHTVLKCGIDEKFCFGIFRVLKILTCGSPVQVWCSPTWSVNHLGLTLRTLCRLAFLKILMRNWLLSVQLEGILSLALSAVEWTIVQFVGVYIHVGRPSVNNPTAVLSDDLLSFWDLWWLINDESVIFFGVLSLQKLDNLKWDISLLTCYLELGM